MAGVKGTRKQWQEKVTPKLFEYCIGEIDKYDNMDEYVENVIASPLWDTERVYRDGREEWAESVWKACHRHLSDIVEYSGLSKEAFHRYFAIPRSTFQDWLYDRGGAPQYTLFMMQEVLGMVTRY